MPAVDRAFGFYIKYWQQMEALYRNADEKALLQTLQEEPRRMIEPVGRRADKQAAELMKRCAAKIEEHFRQLNCNVKRRSQRSTTKNKYGWWTELWLWPKPGRNNRKWTTGVSIEEDHESSPTIVFYLWARGGEPAEQKLTKILGKAVRYRSVDFDWDAGSVFIGEGIPLRVDKDDNFGIDRDVLVEEVCKRLKKVRKRDVEKFFKIQVT